MVTKIPLLLQARMGSSRLPGKVLLPVLGKPILELMIERINNAKLIEEVILITSTNPKDDELVEFAKSRDLKYFRGKELDCLDRHYQAAKEFKLDFFAKTTSDCCLIDPQTIDRIVKSFLKNISKYDYVSNITPPTFPDGLDVEVFNFKILEKVWKNAMNNFDREHTTTYIRSNPKKFKIHNISNKLDKNLFKSQRWCLDYLEDYNFIKKIYENLYPTNKFFSMIDIINYLEKNPKIYAINHHLIKFNTVHELQS